MTDVQQLADELAERLRRSVAIDDPRGALIASSRHFGDEDTSRINVVLSRTLDPDTAKYLASFDIRSATDKVVIPAKPELGLKARSCYPLRHHRDLLGFIWLIDDTRESDDVVLAYVTDITDALARRNAEKSDEFTESAALGRRLLLDRGNTHDTAEKLRSRGFSSGDASVQLIAAVGPLHLKQKPELLRLRSTPPMQEWTRTGHAVIEVVLDSAAVLVCDLRNGNESGVEELASNLVSTGTDTDLRIGCSEPGPLDHAPWLLGQALFSACAGHVFTELDPVNSWVGLYPYRLLTGMVADRPHDIVPPGKVARLFEPANEVLLETLEAYLDSGGDRSATADVLYIHRSTLYYRLSQIHKLTGHDLAHGPDRLALHLATKLHRIGRSNLVELLQTVEISDR